MAALADPTLVATAADPMLPHPYRVVATRRDTVDVVTLTFTPQAAPIAPVGPGQFVMIWSPGVGEVPISVSGLGTDGTVELTIRTVGAVSSSLTAMSVGDVVGLRGPYGTAWPVAEAAGRDTVVVAGGLGLAPLRLAIDALATGGGTGPARLSVVIGSREPAQLLYPDDLERWQAAGVHVHTTVDAADRTWTGAVGTATALLQRLAEAHGLAFVCGPEVMMTSAARALIALGTSPERVHVSLERNMHCGIAHCGRCQLGPLLLCRDGAVVRWDLVDSLLEVRGR